ncbi:6-phospho-3-hexuloisomerase [Lentibacillus halodurans]|uniref:6-phospho-3-hexuloisomerase n=1 Tax=Lentibacillus halodurans TaxID=237679 RepID=A0A1I0W6Z8_9BACI|nr:6-phospho-3-hexuloisomerase [Lentibacillus halodurans]SFA84472.1 6-phospho-3-hexuloisomerase [Lentibacillus halodurans]
MKKIHLKILEELKHVGEQLENAKIESFSSKVNQANRIFVAGEGRSGLMGKTFAMRLLHAGYNVFVKGETITPSIQEGDVLVAISGSGNTASIRSNAKQAKNSGAGILLVTTAENSDLGRLADEMIRIPAATKYRRHEELPTIQPMGNQFDQSVHILLDAIVIALTQSRENINDYMKEQHDNLD